MLQLPLELLLEHLEEDRLASLLQQVFILMLAILLVFAPMVWVRHLLIQVLDLPWAQMVPPVLLQFRVAVLLISLLQPAMVHLLS